MRSVVNLDSEARALPEHWSPRVVGQVNDQYVKVARLLGELTWHKHDAEDELFLVLEGELVIQYRDRDDVVLKPGDMHVVPRGVLHSPVAERECRVALVETVTTRHTGDVNHPRTRSIDEQLRDADG